MVERTIGRNCPFCNAENPIYVIRTDVVSGITTRTCSSCGQSFIEYTESGTPSPMSQVRALRRRSQAGIPQSLSPQRPRSFGSPPRLTQGRVAPLFSPPSSPQRPSQEGKIEEQQLESKNDPAFELTQPVTNSQSSLPSEPSSPEGLSSGEQVRRRGGPRETAMQERLRAIRLARNTRVPGSRANSYRTLVDPEEQRRRVVRALNEFEGRPNVPEILGSNQRYLDGIARVAAANPVPMTPRERAQRLADADAAVASAAAVPLPSSLAAQPMMTRTLANPPAMMHKVSEAFELKKKIKKAERNHPSRQPAAKYLLFEYNKKNKTKKPRKAYDVYLGDTPITELLKDKDEDGDPQDNIILQRDTKPYNAVSIPKDYLKNLLTTNNYFNHTKYQCSDTVNESLDITEDDIVFDKENRVRYQFINGKALNIHDGLFLRSELLKILKSKKKYFLFHVHNINITPIASADKVRWFNPPKRIKGWSDNIPDWNSYEQGTALNEAHMEVGDMVSADHCQKGFTNFLITIAPMKNSRTAKFYSDRTKTKRMGGRRKTKKKKSKKNKRKKSRRRRKQKGGDDEEPIPFKELVDGKTYDFTFNEEFVNDDNNAPMSINMTNVLFEKMPDHQEGYFKLTFLHQKDGEKEENILYEENEYGKGKTVYAKRKSGRPGVSPGAGGRRKTKRKKNKKKKGKKSRKKR